MINRTIAIWGIILLFACKTKDVVKKVDETEVPKPSWVKSRPINSFDYIGIGSILSVVDDDLLCYLFFLIKNCYGF